LLRQLLFLPAELERGHARHRRRGTCGGALLCRPGRWQSRIPAKSYTRDGAGRACCLGAPVPLTPSCCSGVTAADGREPCHLPLTSMNPSFSLLHQEILA
jgi:hypothetical protein